MTDKKLKILLINRWVGYNQGGNETHMQELMEWFLKKGHEVTVITTNGTALDKIDGLEKIYVNTPKGYYSYGLSGFFYAGLFLIKCFYKVLRLRMKGRVFDVLSIHFSLEAVLARLLKLVFGYPYVMVLAGDTSLEIIEGKRANGAIHISNFMNDQSRKMGYSGVVIPKGFDLTRFNPNTNVDDLKLKYQIKPNEKILVSVCRLDPRKNLITLIEAMDIIVNREKIDEIRLFIVGDGVEKQFLENSTTRYGLNRFITFVGALPTKDVELTKHYVLADLFVLPTLYEGFGWVYLEAMACGTPVLTTKVGSNPEIVGSNGILVEPKNPETLARAIVKAVYNERLLAELKQRGFQKAKSIPWEKQIQEYEEFYTDVSSEKCNNVLCKLTVLGYIIIDAFSIVTKSLKASLYSKLKKNTSLWTGEDQVGLK